MYKVNCYIKPHQGIQIEFDDIEDFYFFNEQRKQRKEKDHIITGFVKSINCEVIFLDEYNTGLYEWYVKGGKFLNYLEPIAWHPLEDYIE